MATRQRLKERIDRILVERQILVDENTAQRWIMSGSVLVNGNAITKPGTRIDLDSEIVVRGLNQKYVSRGGYKLESALDRFRLDVSRKIVLDAGASTGGFTDCLLQRGASFVYAIDVGFGQMRGAIAADQRVRNMERTNISELTIEALDPHIDLAVADLSYLSLTRAIPILLPLFQRSPILIGLIKPLFEGVPQQHKNSITEIEQALKRLHHTMQAIDLAIADLIVSPIVGSRGTIEFLGLFTNALPPKGSFAELRDEAIADAKQRFSNLIELP